MVRNPNPNPNPNPNQVPVSPSTSSPPASQGIAPSGPSSTTAVRAEAAEFASLQLAWDTVKRGRSFGAAKAWSPDQLAFFRYLNEQLDVECVWDLDANLRKRH